MTNKLPPGTIHGGAGALKAVREGKSFSGLAHIAQGEVEARLNMEGIEGELARDAKRLQVVSDLYFDAFAKAMQDGDHEKATSMLKVWGWVHNSAIRAWELVRKIKPKNDISGFEQVIKEYREGEDASNH
jgi:hypothetical protein